MINSFDSLPCELIEKISDNLQCTDFLKLLLSCKDMKLALENKHSERRKKYIIYKYGNKLLKNYSIKFLSQPNFKTMLMCDEYTLKFYNYMPEYVRNFIRKHWYTIKSTNRYCHYEFIQCYECKREIFECALSRDYKNRNICWDCAH